MSIIKANNSFMANFWMLNTSLCKQISLDHTLFSTIDQSGHDLQILQDDTELMHKTVLQIRTEDCV